MTTRVTLVTGNTAASREAAVILHFDPRISTAFILEGLAQGTDRLETLAEQAGFPLIRVAPACMCCIGNLTLRVHLNRLLRRPPQRIFISLADALHLDRLCAFLAAPPYDGLLTLAPIIHGDE